MLVCHIGRIVVFCHIPNKGWRFVLYRAKCEDLSRTVRWVIICHMSGNGWDGAWFVTHLVIAGALSLM